MLAREEVAGLQTKHCVQGIQNLHNVFQIDGLLPLTRIVAISNFRIISAKTHCKTERTRTEEKSESGLKLLSTSIKLS